VLIYSACLNDLWRLRNRTWERLHNPSSPNDFNVAGAADMTKGPPARTGTLVFYSDQEQSLFLFGGEANRRCFLHCLAHVSCISLSTHSHLRYVSHHITSGFSSGSSITYMFCADVWSFNVSTRIWTWIGGNETSNHPGRYEQLGIPSTTAFPSARSYTANCRSNDDSVWLFGGSVRGELFSHICPNVYNGH
jgi:hypothetical protein